MVCAEKIKPDIEAIRASGLDQIAQGWCCWRYVERAGGGKPAKLPANASGARLSVDAPDDWPSFEAAASAAGKFNGIGLLLSSARGIVGLDLDGCIDDAGEVNPDRAAIVDDFLNLGSYVEVSPSGTGLRQFLKGVRLEDHSSRGRDGLEIYDDNDKRYLTVTGCAYPVGSPPRSIIANQAALESFIVKWSRATVGASGAADVGEIKGAAGSQTRNYDEVLKLLRTHNRRGRITRLLKGCLDDYDGDHSAADLSLCCEVAYFSRDPAVIDRIMRESGLMRPKWDEMRGAEKYGIRTIKTALEKQDRSFDDDQAAKTEGVKVEIKQVEDAASNLIGGGDDLRTRKGWKSDAWALVELLLRDRRLLGVAYFDEFSGFPVLARNLRDAFGDRSAPVNVGRFTDAHLQAVARWFGRSWGLRLDARAVAAAVAGWAQAVRRNPVKERLQELRAAWDGSARLDGWLVRYCHAEVMTDEGRDIGGYVRAVGARWLVGVVARAMEPGCQMDNMLVLEGRQGARKSSAVRAIAEAIGADYFREGFSVGAGAKDDLIALRGRLIVEWSELSGLNKRDREHVKNFITQRTDSYREVYGITECDWPRTVVFAGTTNESHYLADSTGNRRFWPVKVGRIGLDRLRGDASQIVGEAVARYQDGARWWFDDADPRDEALLRMAEGEQVRRVGGVLWDEIAADLADKLIAGVLVEDAGGAASPLAHFSGAQVRAWLVAATRNELEISDANWPSVAEGLKRAGWESRKINGRMRWRLAAERREAGTLFAG